MGSQIFFVIDLLREFLGTYDTETPDLTAQLYAKLQRYQPEFIQPFGNTQAKKTFGNGQR